MRPMFYMGVYKDQFLAKLAIEALQKFYSDSPILCIADGTKDDIFSQFCADRGVQYTEGERLKLPQFAGRWTERFLKLFLQTDAPLVIKIDPDTRVNRAVEEFPKASIFSMFRYYLNGKRILNGPAIGFTREAAQAILDSGLLHDEKYTTYWYAYPRFRAPMLRPWEEEKFDEFVSLQDEITTDVVERLGLSFAEWGDVSLTDQNAAFVHPPNEPYS